MDTQPIARDYEYTRTPLWAVSVAELDARIDGTRNIKRQLEDAVRHHECDDEDCARRTIAMLEHNLAQLLRRRRILLLRPLTHEDQASEQATDAPI